MPRKTPAATSANGKAASPAPTTPAATEQKLQQLEAEIKAEAAQAKQSTIAPAAKSAQPTTPKAVATVQHLPAKTIVQTLDEFLESRSGRLIQTTCTIFLLTLPAYSFGFADGLLKGLSQAHTVTPASEIAPTSQPPIAPTAPLSPAK